MDAPGHPHEPLLVALVAGHRLGLPLGAVVQLLPMVWVTPLPQAPPVVEGVIDVRGSVVPVLDLRARLGAERRPAVPGDRLVLASLKERLVALRVDHVEELVDVPSLELQGAADLAPDGSAVGVARLEDGLLVVHDLGRFLAADEVIQLDRALAAAQPVHGGAPR